jgi:hypothetical protein
MWMGTTIRIRSGSEIRWTDAAQSTWFPACREFEAQQMKVKISKLLYSVDQIADACGELPVNVTVDEETETACVLYFRGASGPLGAEDEVPIVLNRLLELTVLERYG